MIEYQAKYEAGQQPHICKLITASSGEEFCTEINLSNKAEVENVSDETINEHIKHLIQYLHHLTNGLEVYPEPEVWSQPWPFKNLKEVYETTQEMMDWWGHLNYNDQEGRNIVMTDAEHELLHQFDEPHEHDPVTDEPIYGLGVRGEFGSTNV
jgi:hypothetical protein